MNRIRTAMQKDPVQEALFRGIVEMDETYVGGKSRKMNKKEDNDKNTRGRGTKKLPVVVVAERKGWVAAEPFDDKALSNKNLKAMLEEHVDPENSVLMTDLFSSYRSMKKFITHYAIDHDKQFVDGPIHTNTIESFWSLLKRAWYGQHHHYSRKYAHLYIGESCFKYNNRRNENVFGDTLNLCLTI